VASRLTSLLQEKGFHCFQEIQCTDGDGSIRRVDIVAFKPESDQAYIIDPTVRYESNGDVGEDVQEEKNRLYASCDESLNSIYGTRYGNREFIVYGLWMGARGTVSKQVVQFFDHFKLNRRILPELAETVLIDSIRMIHHHVNGP
jgi:hypothetical protein